MFEDESEIYNLFISQLTKIMMNMIDLLENWKHLMIFNGKIIALPVKPIKKHLKEQIKLVDVVVILSGLYSKDKNLIQQEIDIAVELKKPIVIIRPYGMENVPGSIEKVASEVVGWNTPCIVDAIRLKVCN
jgi:hypothetical protein